jgi:hypothetical protein
MPFEELLLLTLEFCRREQYEICVMKKGEQDKIMKVCFRSVEPFLYDLPLMSISTLLCVVFGSLTKLKSTLMMFFDELAKLLRVRAHNL